MTPQPSDSTRPLYWINSTSSGLGDRLINLFFVLAVARKIGSPLYLDWKPYNPPSGGIVPNYRSQDILLENVQRNIEFPRDIHFVDTFEFPPNAMLLPDYFGWTSSHDFYQKYAHRYFESLECFIGFLQIALRELRWGDLASKVKRQVPKRLVSVHIRRTDKVRNRSEVDEHMISDDELPNLERLTEKWIGELTKSNTNFYVCGDDPESVDRYQHLIRAKGGSLFSPSNIEGIAEWERTYIDLVVMASSKTILQSQRNSSFSRFAAMVGGSRLVNVYKGEETRV